MLLKRNPLASYKMKQNNVNFQLPIYWEWQRILSAAEVNLERHNKDCLGEGEPVYTNLSVQQKPSCFNPENSIIHSYWRLAVKKTSSTKKNALQKQNKHKGWFYAYCLEEKARQ